MSAEISAHMSSLMYSLTCEPSLQILKNFKHNKENRAECLEPQRIIRNFALERLKRAPACSRRSLSFKCEMLRTLSIRNKNGIITKLKNIDDDKIKEIPNAYADADGVWHNANLCSG